MMKQEGFDEADLKEAVDLLHKELFPEFWAQKIELSFSPQFTKRDN